MIKVDSRMASKASPEKGKGPTSGAGLLNLVQKDGADHKEEEVEVNLGFENAAGASPDELRGSDSDVVGIETVQSCPELEFGDGNGIYSS